MTVTPTNVLVGAATFYVAPYGLSVPGNPEPMPANSIPLGGPWGGNWTTPGATKEGVTFSVDADIEDIRIEEQSNPVLTPINTSTFTVGATLMEDTLANMLLAYGRGQIAVTAALAGRADTSCSTTNGSVTVTDASCQAGDVGKAVTGPGIPTGATVANVNAATSFTLSSPATATGTNVSLTIGAALAYSDLTFSDQLTQYTFGFEGVNIAGQARRVYIPLGTAGAKVDTAYRRAAAAREYAVTLNALCAPSQIRVRNIGTGA